jgi:hypothetical protein
MAFVDPLPSGTVTLFRQETTIPGWTKLTTRSDYTLRVVAGLAGAGGSVAFSTVFGPISVTGSFTGSVTGTGATSLTVDQLPSHTHGNYLRSTVSNMSFAAGAANPSPSGSFLTNGVGMALTTGTGLSATAAGHTHPASGTISASLTNATVDFSVKYVDMIQAQKD